MACDPENVVTSAEMVGLKADISTIDDVVESALDTTTTKNGTVINTLNGQLKLLGYEPPVTYAGSIVFTVNDNTVTVDESGVIYAPLPSALPFTTSGIWGGDDDARFFVVQGVTTSGLQVVKPFPTLADAIANALLVEGDSLNIAERTTGNGGGAMWDVVLSSTVTVNTYNIVQCTGVPTLSLVLRTDANVLDANQWGAVGDWDGATGTNNSPVIQAIFAEADRAGFFGRRVDIAYGDYLIEDPIVRAPGIDFIGQGRNATRFFFTNAISQAIAFDVGGSVGSTAGGGSVKGMQVILLDDDLVCLRLNGTQFEAANDLFLRGASGTQVSSKGLVMDGGSVSSFFNNVTDVLFQSLDVGLEHSASAGGFGTASTYINVSGVLCNTGMLFVGANGLSSQIYGGNWESCTTAIQFETNGVQSTDKVQMFGVRFEANTVDVDLGTDSFRNTLMLQNTATITDNGTGSGNVILTNGNYNRIPMLTSPGSFGSSNMSIGNASAFNSMSLDNTRKNNLNFGQASMQGITTEVNNNNFGNETLTSAAGARNNTHGSEIAENATNLDRSTIMGDRAGLSITDSDNLALFGNLAGRDITTGENNTCMGANSGSSTSPFNITTEDNRVVVGDSNVTNAYIQVAWTVTSDERDKDVIGEYTHGLDFINKLRPIEFYYDNRNRYENGISDGSKKDAEKKLGLSAQDVLQVEQELGIKGVVNNENPEKLLLVETGLIYSLINSVNELTARLEVLESSS